MTIPPPGYGGVSSLAPRKGSEKLRYLFRRAGCPALRQARCLTLQFEFFFYFGELFDGECQISFGVRCRDLGPDAGFTVRDDRV